MSKLIFIASFAYLLSSALLFARMKGYQLPWARNFSLGLVILASIIHGFLLWGTLLDDSSIQMGLGVSLSLAGWLSTILVIVSSIKKPMESLGIVVFPLSLISLWLAPMLPPPHLLAMGIGIHALASLIAYTLLG
ncbi:MAG: hypothetical protein B7Y29_01020, partial [Thiotrichales bacterium 16-46-22]